MRAETTDILAKGFERPPQAARPRVFWHWVGGEISQAGIDLDLAWMKRTGLGGAQIVEVDLGGTPALVDKRLVFGTADWGAAVRHAAGTARGLGLDLGVATSPGWSATGGPWVKPAGAMKKLVWSQLKVDGVHAPDRLVLPPLPSVAGPFQTVPAPNAPAAARAPFSVDAAVVAYKEPSDAEDAPPPVRVTTSGGDAIDPGALSDGDVARTQALGLSRAGTAWIRLDYAEPRTVRAITLGLPGPRGFGAPPSPDAWLEASEDGAVFRPVAELPAAMSQRRTVSFPAVRARSFRVRFATPAGAGGPPTAPGVVPLPPAPRPSQIGVSELMLHGETRVSHVEEKAGFATALDYGALASPRATAGSVTAPGEVVDLTGRMHPDGSLEWRPPPGRWVVLRLGYSLTGQTNGPAEPEMTGLEADKLDAGSVTADLDAFFGRYEAALGRPLGAAGVDMLLADSIEAGPQNWTDALPAEFRRRRGYDMTPWLPALTGVVVGSSDASDRFLWDFRQTLAELFLDGQTAAVAHAAHARGLSLYSEALEDHRPQLGDDMAMRRLADLPMGAMWTFPQGGEPRPTFVADIQGAASVAHVYGQNLVAAESMTAFGAPWAFSPQLLKPIADRELVLGVNVFDIHSSVHQPLVDAAPGLTIANQLGQDFNRNETWAEMARPWIDYLARSAFLMQQGHAAADVAYFYGEDTPLTALYGDRPVRDAPKGYGFDFVNADVVLNQLSVRGGRLRSPGGGQYRLLYLGGASRRMTLTMLRRIGELARQGAAVVGERPEGSPSLADDPNAFSTLASSLWLGASLPGGHRVGGGRIVSGRPVETVLRDLGAPPDIELGASGLLAAHRRLADGELYFVVNTTARAVETDARFRVRGRAPELWRADTVSHAPVGFRQLESATEVHLSLAPNEAVFVVFRRPTTALELRLVTPHEVVATQITGPWRVKFDPSLGAPQEIKLFQLAPLNENADPGVRYYSGVADYRKIFIYTPATSKERVSLDIGAVHEIAQVIVNGREAGTAWKPPFRIDVTGLLRSGRNELRIRVADLWVNRLVGDAHEKTEVAKVNGRVYRADAPLPPSGLLGPVRLVASSGQ